MSFMYAATTLAILLLFRDVTAQNGPSTCDREAMSKCTKPLRVLTDNRDLGFAASERELSRLCPTLMDGMECFDRFTMECLKPQHRSYFNTLYTGTQLVISDLCTDGFYQTEYLRHAPCMRSVQRGYEVCADEYHSQMDLISPGSPVTDADRADLSVQIRMLCCSFKTYLHCSQQAVLHRCGIGTSNFTKNFLERMAGPLVQTHCAEFMDDTNTCVSGAGGARLAGPAAATLLLPSLLVFRAV